VKDKLYLPVLLGTVRQSRRSDRVAELVVEVGRGLSEVETELVDPREFNFQGEGEGPENKNPRFSQLTARADGFFIVTPEYNHGYPGTLKRMLDSELDNYRHKAVVVAGVSVGPWGGVRAIHALLPTLRRLGLVVLPVDAQFPNVQEIFDKNGRLLDEARRKDLEKIWWELIKLARVLKHGRQTVWK
jgi:NAD(P)H-dependent FMN reductase